MCRQDAIKVEFLVVKYCPQEKNSFFSWLGKCSAFTQICTGNSIPLSSYLCTESIMDQKIVWAVIDKKWQISRFTKPMKEM